MNTVSLLCGFLIIFTGVYLLNLSRSDPNGQKSAGAHSGYDATPTDMVSSFQTRRSMQARRSGDPSRHSIGSAHGDREGLIRAYDEEEAAGFGLTDLAEESDGEGSHRPNGHNGRSKEQDTIELQSRKSTGR